VGGKAIAGLLEENRTMTVLDLSNNNLGDHAAVALAAELKANTTMKELRLGFNEIKDIGATAFAGILKSLQVQPHRRRRSAAVGDGERCNSVTAAHEQNRTLVSLKLNSNKITDEGGESMLKMLQLNDTLFELDLLNNRIKAEVAFKLKRMLGCGPTHRVAEAENAAKAYEQALADAKSLLVSGARSLSSTPPITFQRKFEVDVGGVLLTDFGVELLVDAGTRVAGLLYLKKLSGDQVHALQAPPLGTLAAGPIVELLPQDRSKYSRPITLRIPHNSTTSQLKVIYCKWLPVTKAAPELQTDHWAELPPSAYRVFDEHIEVHVSEGANFAVIQDDITPGRVGCRAFRLANEASAMQRTGVTPVQVWLTPERKDRVQELQAMLASQGFVQCGMANELLHGMHKSRLTSTLRDAQQSKVWDYMKPQLLFNMKVPADEESTAVTVKLQQSFKEAIASYHPEQIARLVSTESSVCAKYTEQIKDLNMSGNTFLQLDDARLRDVLKVEGLSDRKTMLELVHTLNAPFITELALTLSAKGQQGDDNTDVHPEDNLPRAHAPHIMLRGEDHFLLRSRAVGRTKVGFKVDEMVIEVAEVGPEAEGLPVDKDYHAIPCHITGWGDAYLQFECNHRVFTGFVRLRTKDYSGLGLPSKAVPILPFGFSMLDAKKARRLALKGQNQAIARVEADARRELAEQFGELWADAHERTVTAYAQKNKVPPQLNWKTRLVPQSSPEKKRPTSANPALLSRGRPELLNQTVERPSSANPVLVSHGRPDQGAASRPANAKPGSPTNPVGTKLTKASCDLPSIKPATMIRQIREVAEEAERSAARVRTFISNCKCLANRLRAIATSLPFVSDGDEPQLAQLLENVTQAKMLINMHFAEGYLQRYILLDDDQAFNFEAIDDKLVSTVGAVHHWAACSMAIQASGRYYKTVDAEICNFKRRKLVELILRACNQADSSHAPPNFRAEAVKELCNAKTGFGIFPKELKIEMGALFKEGGLPHVQKTDAQVKDILGQEHEGGFLEALELNISTRGGVQRKKSERTVGTVVLTADIQALALAELEDLQTGNLSLVRHSDGQWTYGIFSKRWSTMGNAMEFQLDSCGAVKTFTPDWYSEVRRLSDRTSGLTQSETGSLPPRGSLQGVAVSKALLGMAARADDQRHFVAGLRVGSVALVCRENGVWYYSRVIRRVEHGLVEQSDLAVETGVGNDGFTYGVLTKATDEIEFSLEDCESKPKKQKHSAKRGKKGQKGRDRLQSLPEVLTTANRAQQAAITSRKGSAPLVITKWAVASVVGVGASITGFGKKKRTKMVLPPARFCAVRQLEDNDASHHGAHAAHGRAMSNIHFPGRHLQSQMFYIASFPGKHEAEWLNFMEREGKSCNRGDFGREQRVSAACVFFCHGSAIDGVHAVDPSSADGRCYCDSLYGAVAGEPHAPASEAWRDGKAPFGCFWFECWTKNVQRAQELGQLAVVVNLAGKRGDKTKGLGPSQKSEVAWLEKNHIPYFSWDLNDFMQSASRVARAYDRPRNRAPHFQDINSKLDSMESWSSRREQLDPGQAISIIARQFDEEGLRMGRNQLAALQDAAANLTKEMDEALVKAHEARAGEDQEELEERGRKLVGTGGTLTRVAEAPNHKAASPLSRTPGAPTKSGSALSTTIDDEKPDGEEMRLQAIVAARKQHLALEEGSAGVVVAAQEAGSSEKGDELLEREDELLGRGDELLEIQLLKRVEEI
jgi:hypothetical protein